ncbi:MAG: type II secretion system F family protein [Planctomycetaceae bacterium]|jgi:type II secretory pathway component PulF
MPELRTTYRFSALDDEGKTKSGTTEALHPDAVLGDFERRRWTLLDLRALPRGLSPREAEELASHIATMAEAGLPLETGLAALAEELPNRRLRRALQRLVESLSRGVDLETALNQTGAPAYVQALARTGTQSNTLGKTFSTFAQAGESLRSTLPLVMGALLYTLLACLLCIVVWVVAAVFVLPQFALLYTGFGMELPLLTRVVLALGNFRGELAFWILGGVLLWAGVMAIVLGTPLVGRERARRWLHRVPGLGTVVRSLALSRFALLTSTLLDNSVPLPEALELGGDATGDAAVRADAHELARLIRQGEPVNPLDWKRRSFRPGFLSTLRSPQSGESLVRSLQATAEVYAARVRTGLLFLGTFLPPLLVTLLGLVVGMTVLALYLPLFKLLNMLS